MANMKYLIIFALIAVLLNRVTCDYDDDDDYCQSDAHCDRDECCMKSFRPGSRSKVCRDKGDDVGEPCGGEYHCSTCANWLDCVRDASGNGYCQRGNRPSYV